MTPTNDFILGLLKKSSDLRNMVPTALTLSSPEAVEAEVAKRDEFKVELREAMNDIADKIDELRAWKRTLDTEADWQGTDVKKLTALKWELVNARKNA